MRVCTVEASQTRCVRVFVGLDPYHLGARSYGYACAPEGS